MHSSLTHRLQNQYDQIDLIISNCSETYVKYRHRLNKWSIHEHLAHLARYHEVFAERLNQILTVSSPSFERYVAEQDVQFTKWLNPKLETSDIISQTKKKRAELYTQLLQLSALQLQRIGIHPKLGKLTIEEWTQFFLFHESHHFYAIFKMIHEFKV